MSRQASTPAKTAQIFANLIGSQCKAQVRLSYEKAGSWLPLNDFDESIGVDWDASGLRFEYSNVSLVPAASKIKFSVINRLGEYSPGSGTALDNVLDLNTRIKLEAGYDLNGTVEWVYTSIFYLDFPEYSDPPAPDIPEISCTGRDAFKFALEKSINLSSTISGTTIDALIKYVCDQIGLKYSATSIDDLSTFGTRTLSAGLLKITNASDIFNFCMQILNKQGFNKYFMYLSYDADIDDNILFVKPRPSTVEEVFVFNRNNVSDIGSKRKNYDRLIQRISFFNKKETLQAEVLLGTATYTTPGVHTITWSGKAEYKRIIQSGIVGAPVITLVSPDGVEPEFVSFNISGTFTSVTLSVYGSKWSVDPAAQGESIVLDNMFNYLGRTLDNENELINSDTEARLMAEGFVRDFGDPKFEVSGVEWPYLNLMFDQNDIVLLWSQIVFIDTLYIFTNVSHHWDRSSSPNESTKYTMIDSGFTFEEFGKFIYDDVEKYEAGFSYDMVFGVTAPDDVTNYDYLKPIIFT